MRKFTRADIEAALIAAKVENEQNTDWSDELRRAVSAAYNDGIGDAISTVLNTLGLRSGEDIFTKRTGLVSRDAPQTSKDAASLIAPRAGTFRYRVLKLIANSGGRGLTRDEIAELGKMDPNTVRPRVRELFDGDFITVKLDDRGRHVTRKTPNRRDAEVLEVTRKGHAALGRTAA